MKTLRSTAIHDRLNDDPWPPLGGAWPCTDKTTRQRPVAFRKLVVSGGDRLRAEDNPTPRAAGMRQNAYAHRATGEGLKTQTA